MQQEVMELEQLRTAVQRWKLTASALALLLVLSVIAVITISQTMPSQDHSVGGTGAAERAAEAVRVGDYASALELLSVEAEQGGASAQYMLGRLYAGGLGVKQDYRAAYQWFKRAAEKDEPNAQYALASMYAYGQGVGRDDAKAAMWSIRAREQGYGAPAGGHPEQAENQ